jgi:hypothetical protein
MSKDHAFTSSLPVNDPVRTTAPSAYRTGGFSNSTMTRPTTAGGSRAAAQKSFGSSVGPGTRQPVSKYKRTGTAMGHTRSNTSTGILRPTTSMDHHSASNAQGGYGQQNGIVDFHCSMSSQARKRVVQFRSTSDSCQDYINSHLQHHGVVGSSAKFFSCHSPTYCKPGTSRSASACAAPRPLELEDGLSGCIPSEKLRGYVAEPSRTPSRLPRAAKTCAIQFPTPSSLSIKKKRSPKKEMFLSKDSNLRVAPFDPEERLRDMSSFWESKFEEFSSQMSKSMSERGNLDEVVTLLKAKGMFSVGLSHLQKPFAAGAMLTFDETNF